MLTELIPILRQWKNAIQAHDERTLRLWLFTLAVIVGAAALWLPKEFVPFAIAYVVFP